MNGDLSDDSNAKSNFKLFNLQPLERFCLPENSAPLSSNHLYFHFTFQYKLAISNTLPVYRALHLRI